MQVQRNFVAEHRREETRDLGQVLLVPEWPVPVQGRRDDDLQVRPGRAHRASLGLEALENALDGGRHSPGAVGVDQHLSDGGDDADRRLGSDLAQTTVQGHERVTRDDLGILHGLS